MPRTQRTTTLLLTITILGLMAASTPTLRAASAPVTLSELAATALANHEDMARADSQLRRAQADVKLSTSVLLPRLELNGAFTRYRDTQTLELAPGEEFELRPLSDWYWSADLSQTLFSGLRDWRARDVARLYRDTAELERRSTAADLVLEVAHSFFSAVAAAEQVDVRRASLTQLEAQLKVSERRYEVGEVTVADVARWRAEVAAEKQRLVVAEGDAELSRRRLARLVGLDELGELEPLGRIPVPAGDDESLTTTALEQRLEMQTLSHQVEAAGLMIKVEQGNWLPTLDAHAQYYKQKAVFPSQDWMSVALTLKVPVYDGGLTAARVAKAREDLLEIELLGSELEKGIRDQVESSAINLRAAEAALAAAGERSEAAREAHRQVERAYRAGEASATDLLATTSALSDAETAHIIARWQRELQAIALRHAVGENPLPDLDLKTITTEEDQS